MVARDGVERFRVQSFQQLADSTKDRKDTEDTKDRFCVRFVCDFSFVAARRNWETQSHEKIFSGSAMGVVMHILVTLLL